MFSQGDLGYLDLKFKFKPKSILKGITRPKAWGKFLTKAIPGAVGGFVMSGFNPIGAVAGASAGFVGGKSKPLKSFMIGSAIGGAAGAAAGKLLPAGSKWTTPLIRSKWLGTTGLVRTGRLIAPATASVVKTAVPLATTAASMTAPKTIPTTPVPASTETEPSMTSELVKTAAGFLKPAPLQVSPQYLTPEQQAQLSPELVQFKPETPAVQEAGITGGGLDKNKLLLYGGLGLAGLLLIMTLTKKGGKENV
jgi:hypothetical protein